MKTADVFQVLEDYKPNILGYDQLQKFSLLLPIVTKKGEPHLLFEVRSFQMRSQPGDVCFPGGRVDQEDQTILHSVLRETEEEIGIDQTYIKQIVPLDYIVTNFGDFGGIIYPFVGEITSLEALSINEEEVAEVFTVPLRYFLEEEPKKYKIAFEVVPEEGFPYHLIHGGKNYDWRPRRMDELFYEYEGRIIWGLTARIIYHFVDLLKGRYMS